MHVMKHHMMKIMQLTWLTDLRKKCGIFSVTEGFVKQCLCTIHQHLTSFWNVPRLESHIECSWPDGRGVNLWVLLRLGFASQSCLVWLYFRCLCFVLIDKTAETLKCLFLAHGCFSIAFVEESWSSRLSSETVTSISGTLVALVLRIYINVKVWGQ